VLIAVVVTYRAPREMLETCLNALREAGRVDRIIVVDNGGTASIDDQVGAVELVQPGTNLGFGGGANLGFRRAIALGADLVALLNDDVRVDADWLTPILGAFADDDTGDGRLGVVQPMLLNEGSDPPTINSAGVILDRMGQGGDIASGRALADIEQFDRQPIELFTGGCIVLRRQFLEATGGFDESLFLYYEDVDLARRGATKGWRYELAHRSQVWHRGSASTSAQPGLTRYLQERNRLWNLARHESAAAYARGVWLSIRRVRHRPRAIHARALLAGLTRTPRALISRMGARKSRNHSSRTHTE